VELRKQKQHGKKQADKARYTAISMHGLTKLSLGKKELGVKGGQLPVFWYATETEAEASKEARNGVV
jgi:hypothetical protein